MKIRIEIVEGLEEEEVVIRCGKVDDTVRALEERLRAPGANAGSFHPVFLSDGQEFYFPLEDVLFFETEGEAVFAHTAKDSFRTPHRLYELEEALPGQFLRISKSAIINLDKIYSITRDLTSSTLVRFADTRKQVYASRRYAQALRKALAERRSRP